MRGRRGGSLRRLEIGVAEHVAHGHRVENTREEGARGVAEVVEAERWDAGEGADGDVAAAESRAVDPVAGGVGEDVVVRAGEVRALREPVEGAERLIAERDVADLSPLRRAFDVAR